MSEVQPEPAVDDVFAQLQEVAERLATLSMATESPADVPTAEPFDAAEVDFDSWQHRLLAVEGWLDLRTPLDNSSPEAFNESLGDSLGVATPSPAVAPSPVLLDKLQARADEAVRAQAIFMEAIQGANSTPEAATARWQEAWEDSPDEDETQSSEPVNAVADTWRVSEFVALAKEREIDLAPSYQRSDVWTLTTRQMLIESILRGIPLPSIILLNHQNAGTRSPYDVVDGRQRLTTILRFIGAHPTALAKVQEVAKKHKNSDLMNVFAEDYPDFKKIWRSLEGPLSAKHEEKYYFPFKLRTGDRVMQGPLEALRGRYYSQIRHLDVQNAGGKEKIRKLFESTSQYKVPVIVYKKATAKQIHEVFNLYNKQGVHLNAEEIRNAIFHELEITRAVLVASGDFVPREDGQSIAPSLDKIGDQIGTLHETLSGYGLTAARYRRSKIVSWVLATLLHRPDGVARRAVPGYGSTAKHIDSFLQEVQDGAYTRLTKADALADLFTTLASAAEVHASVEEEVWTDEFKQGAKWLDLELVGSLVGVLAAAMVLGPDLPDAMDTSSEQLGLATTSWKRPNNAQSASQWVYMATIARGTVVALGVDPVKAHEAVVERFDTSGLGSLFSLAPSSNNTTAA